MVFLLAFPAGGWAIEPAVTPEVPSRLTLSDALRLALTASPGLRALEWEIRKAEGRTVRAAARPNPALGLDVENLGGSGSQVPASETAVAVGQPLELGGKRSKRIAAARAEQQSVLIDVEAGRIELMGETKSRFLEALAAEKLLEISNQEVRAAEEAAATTRLRVTAGASHPVESQRADVELASSRLEQVSSRTAVDLTRVRLAALWGGELLPSIALEGSLDSLPVIPPLDSLKARITLSPIVRRGNAERVLREQRLVLERALAVPDLEARFGVRRFSEPSASGLLAGVALPLPIFNRNRGGQMEARAALSQSERAIEASRNELGRALTESHATLRRERGELDTILRDILPGAEQALEAMRLGFERGRFSYLDYLEARRTVLRARRELLRSRLESHLSMARIEQLLGTAVLPADLKRGEDR